MSGPKLASKPAGALARVLAGYADDKSEASTVRDAPPVAADAGSAHGAPVRVYPIKGRAKVPSELCAPWPHADRQPWEFDHVDDLAESFATDGQLQPALVFLAPAGSQPSGSPVRYLIVAGVARWVTAKKTGIPLDVDIREFADERAAFRAMVRENEHRRPLSDYSKAKRFQRALATGVYSSATALAADNRISKGEVSKLMRLAELDEEVVGAFSSPGVLTTKLGYALALSIEAGYRGQVLRDAKKIESGEIPIAAIPSLWGGSPIPSSDATEATTKGNATAASGEAGSRRFPVRHVTDKGGARLFSVIKHPSRGVTVRISPTIDVDEAFIMTLAKLAARSARRKESPAKP